MKNKSGTVDPMQFASFLWPDVKFYKKQREIIYSIVENDETYVPAANMTGKDFVAGFICLWFFCTRQPCRIVTTSVKDDHLRVLWGEIGRYIQTSSLPKDRLTKGVLDSKMGGPLLVNHHEIKYVENGKTDKISYLIGRVSEKGEGMQGHHVAKTGDGIPRTLFVVDEASGAVDDYYTMASTWADRMLIIGNPWPCNNFFKRHVQAGDVPKLNGYHK